MTDDILPPSGGAGSATNVSGATAPYHVTSFGITGSPPLAPRYDRFISRNAKALAALVIGGLSWGATVVHSPSHAVTATEWLQLGGSVAAALGVYGATNKGA